MDLVQTGETAFPEPEVKRNPLLGLVVILCTCVPFWAAVAWLALR